MRTDRPLRAPNLLNPRILRLEALENRSMLSIAPGAEVLAASPDTSAAYVAAPARDTTVAPHAPSGSASRPVSADAYGGAAPAPYVDAVHSAPMDALTADAYGGLATTAAPSVNSLSTASYGGSSYGGTSYGETSYGGDPYGGNTPPTSNGPMEVAAQEDTPLVVSIQGLFNDAQTPDRLTYHIESIQAKPGPGLVSGALFGDVWLGSSGNLHIAFTPEAYGDGTIIIRAVDPGGLSVAAAVNVHVAPVNDPPVITGFCGQKDSNGFWTFTGTATDVDDSLVGMSVVFGGVLSGYSAVVGSSGTFVLKEYLPDLNSGTASATVTDPHGLASEPATITLMV